jgi:hypothetical protein
MRKMTPAKRLLVGLAIAAGATVPLLLYVILGPRHGNPIGLGLLMWLGWLVGLVLMAWGAIGLVISQFKREDP